MPLAPSGLILLRQGLYGQTLQPALTHTSKAIRSESLPVFYDDDAFVKSFDSFSEVENAVRWARAIGDTNWKLVKRILILDEEREGVYKYPLERRALAAHVEFPVRGSFTMCCIARLIGHAHRTIDAD